ncbi:putative spermidine/putrescine transport system permease protein [Azorhizobium sp. AG788]|uniref:ABC transporter permease n=1 Tax=Azorhizobium sp. AG788 TaxID=2183897 RepID=UPI0010CF619E|nr:ABC transporter permease subunit [Azorhizobium sp. AG788]TDT99295.1 putative spermidine/putrescine transport system permease protein [Azorhizobium sp. AG788]
MLATCLYLLFLFAPIALLVMGSLGESWTNTLLPSGLTGRWYAELAADPSFQRAFLTSLKVVTATCILDMLIAVPLAYALHSTARRGVQAAARVVTLLPIATPELVLGFGFILVFSSDALPFIGSIWLLIAAHVVVTLPYLLNILLSDMTQLKLGDLERVAATLGAPFMSRFFDIVLPLVRHSLFAGLITVSAISIGEFQISNLIAGFLTRTYPITLLQAFYGATGFACAATVVLLVLAVTASAAGALTARAARTG